MLIASATAAGASRSTANLTAIWRWPRRKKEMVSDRKHQLYSHSPSPPLPTTARSSRFATAARSSSNDIVTFSYSVSTDIPLYEPPGVSFDDYIFDRPRVFRAMFPDTRRSKRLNDEEWMIQMLPIQFLFATVNPVVVMRLRHKSKGNEYPPDVPEHATSVLELQATRWELRGLQDVQMPPHFALIVQGVMYPDRSSKNRRLKGHLEMGFSMILPPIFKLVPEDVLRGIADAVLRRMLEKMKHEVDVGVISDYANFWKEKSMKHGAAIQAPSNSFEMRGKS